MPRAAALLLLVACAHQGRVDTLAERVADLDWTLTPALPSPDAGTYMTAPGRPRDVLVARMVDGYAHDRSLEAGATGLALAAVEGLGGLTRWELRESLWRGGWPYPVQDARGWSSLASEPPPQDLLAWLDGLPRDVPIGLVRARGRMGDGWIGMRGQPDVDLGMLPRRMPLGGTLTLPAVPGATWRLSDGGGTLSSGTLDAGASLLLSSAGEWLMQILRDGRELARFPVYVGIDAPEEPLLRARETPPLIGTADDAVAWAEELLRHVRKAYGLKPWTPDSLLATAARTLAREPDRPVAELLRPLAVDTETARVWMCDDNTVENCLDRWVWDPALRGALLSNDLDAIGLYGTVDPKGVHLTAVLGTLG